MTDEKMIIAIDYDNSFTTNKKLFSDFIQMIKSSNTHIPIFCTARDGLSFNPSVNFTFDKKLSKAFKEKNSDIYKDCLNLNIPVVFSYGYKSKRDALIKHGYKIYKDKSLYDTDIKLSNVIYFDDYPENIINMYKKENLENYFIIDHTIFYDLFLLFKTKYFDKSNNEKYFLWMYDKVSEDYNFLYNYNVFDITNKQELIDNSVNIDDILNFCEKNKPEYRVKIKVYLDMYSTSLKNEDVQFI